MDKIKYLINGRSALDQGIKLLSLKESSKILVPEIICDVAVEVLLKNKLDVVYYKLDTKFQPIWSDLYKKTCLLLDYVVAKIRYTSELKKK